MPITMTYYTYLSKLPVKEPLSKFPIRTLWRDADHQGLLHVSFRRPSKEPHF
jgi:hypothetical protein